VWELHVEEAPRRRGVGTWLVGHGADWLRLARVERVLDSVIIGEDDAHAFLTALGWRELTRAERAWRRARALSYRSALPAARAATSTGS
jgi:GNAT superfamily N-acetyltransferase